MPYWRAFYHLISATRDREQLIDGETEDLLERSFKLTADDLELIVHATGYMPDHIHMTLSIPPKHSVAETVKRLKGAAAHRVNGLSGNKAFGWQGEYGVLTFGERDVANVNAYVLNQKERHANGRTSAALERIDPDHYY